MWVNPRVNPVSTARDLRRSRRRDLLGPVRAWNGDRSLHHARDVGDGSHPWALPRRLVPGRDVPRNRHHHGRRGHDRRSKIESLARCSRFHEHTGNDNGTGDYAGEHDGGEQAREDS